MTHSKTALLLAAVPLLTIPLAAHDRQDSPARDFTAQLRGRNEVPVVLSAARGSLTLHVNDTDTSVHFVLEYSALNGGNALFAHIHVGQRNVNGGVTVFFCGGGGRPACPSPGGTVEGDFTANDVLALATQQLQAGNLAKLLAAIRAGETYANVHSTASPGGEIRGQIRAAENQDNQ